MHFNKLLQSLTVVDWFDNFLPLTAIFSSGSVGVCEMQKYSRWQSVIEVMLCTDISLSGVAACVSGILSSFAGNCPWVFLGGPTHLHGCLI